MSKEERVANALRVLVGEPVRPIQTKWWHAFGQVREFPRTDGQPPDRAHQLTVIGPALAGPESARAMVAESWGEYLTSFDHHPSDEERDALVPEEYRDDPDEDELAKRGALSEDDEDAW